MTDEQIQKLRDEERAVNGSRTTLDAICSEVLRHRANIRAVGRIAGDTDRALVAQMAASMASDRGCAPLGEHAADQYVAAARELLAAIDRSAPRVGTAAPGPDGYGV